MLVSSSGKAGFYSSKNACTDKPATSGTVTSKPRRKWHSQIGEASQQELRPTFLRLVVDKRIVGSNKNLQVGAAAASTGKNTPTKRKASKKPARKQETRPLDDFVLRQSHKDVPLGQLACGHFEQCSGCSLNNQLAYPPQYQEAVAFFKSLGVSDVPMVHGSFSGWRRRAKLAVRGTKGNPVIGLYREGSHEVVPIPECVAHHPRINDAVALIHQVAASLEVEPYQEDSGTGLLRYLQLTVVSPQLQEGHHEDRNEASSSSSSNIPSPATLYSQPLHQTTHPVQVVLVVNLHPDCVHTDNSAWSQVQRLADQIWKDGNERTVIHSVWVNFQPAVGNTVLGRSWQHLHGPKDVWEAWGGLPICIAPGSFVQANYEAFSMAVDAMRQAVPADAQHMVEMHAGVGAIGLSLAAGQAYSNSSSSHSHHDNHNDVEVNIQSSQASHLPSVSVTEEETVSAGGVADQQPGSLVLLGSGQQARLKSLLCVEINPEAELAFNKTKAALQSNKESSMDELSLRYVVAAAGSDPDTFLQGADVVVVDPPRKGLEASLLDAFCRLSWRRGLQQSSSSGNTCTHLDEHPASDSEGSAKAAEAEAQHRDQRSPRRLIYLSCGWPALKRDAAALLGVRPVTETTTHITSEHQETSNSQHQQQHEASSPVNNSSNDSSAPKKRHRYKKKKKSQDASTGINANVNSKVWVEGDVWKPSLNETAAVKWRLVSATAFLFFPGTDAIETLAVFEEVV